MVKMGLRRLALVVLSVTLVIGAVWMGGCTTSDETGVLGQKEAPTHIIENITPQEAFTLIEDNRNNPDFVILDVRTPQEFAQGHIAGAIMIDFYSMTFRDDLDALDKDKTYLIYCGSGGRSGKTLDIMEELGFQEVYNLLGGINAWQDAGLPTTTE